MKTVQTEDIYTFNYSEKLPPDNDEILLLHL
jgi:hypothetical protein